jgi:hypothetical protein
MKPNISKVFECSLGFAIALPNLPILVVLGVLSVNQGVMMFELSS